jgi:ABC-type uncharacterized transport system permease subunit
MLTFIWDQSNPTVGSILWPLMVGVIIAAFVVLFHKKTLGKLVKKLFDEGAKTEATAKSLAELGLEKNKFLRYALRPDSTLRKIIDATEVNGELRYYIAEDNAYRAEVTYNPDGSSVLTVVIAILLILIVASVMLILIPDLIQMFKNAFNAF